MVAPEPPGSTSRVRTLYELMTAYDRTLSDSAAITADLTPRNWFGPASESYQERAKTPFESQLRAVQEANAAALEEVERHQDFRAQLTKLWQDPHERAHMRTVHRHASEQLAARLFEKAAELDRLANFTEVQPTPSDPVVLPVPLPGSRRKPPASEPSGPDPSTAVEPRDTPDDENRQAGGTAGVLPPSPAGPVSRDESERAAWLRAIHLPSTVRTDVIWDGDD